MRLIGLSPIIVTFLRPRFIEFRHDFLSMIKRMVYDVSAFGLVYWDLIFISI